MKKDFHGAIKSGFLKLDEELKQNPKSFSIGSTAVVVLVKDGKLFCGELFIEFLTVGIILTCFRKCWRFSSSCM